MDWRLLFLLFFPFLSACAREKEISFVESDVTVSTKMRTGAPTEEELPVVAWYSVSGEHTTLENYRDIKEAGFTHNLSFPAGEQDIENSFGYATQAGLKILLYVDRTWTSEEEMNARVQRYKNHPALFGYYVYDEPSQDKFPEVAQWVRNIRAIDSTHVCYVNLFPNIQNPIYEEYVNNFINQVPVEMLSFDNYPVLGENDSSTVRWFRPDWYENLEIISAASRQAGMPFWAFALATAHTIKIGNDPVSVYPIPTLADLRLQVYSNLAYGAQGIQYFTYFTPTGEGDTFHDGPFYKGNKTKTYYTVKEMNAEIKALSGVFFDSNVLAVFHTGDVIPKGTRKLDPDKTPPLTPFSAIETEGKGAVVSFLEKENIRFMVVVNRDLMGAMKLNVTLKKNAVVRKVLKNGVVENQNMQGSHSIEVEPGDVVIFAYPKVN